LAPGYTFSELPTRRGIPEWAMLPILAGHVAKPGSYVANYLAKLAIPTVSWQHLFPVLNTKRALPRVFRLSLSDFGRKL
jgi:hypothetical protein